MVRRYQELKRDLALGYAQDRQAYAQGKAAFIDAVTEEARRFFASSGRG